MTVLKKASIYVLGIVMMSAFGATVPALAQDDFESGSMDCLVTAYYSPLEGQDYYITGSYEGDVALNGQGTHGASGAAVFEGMLAAPDAYSFGTKMLIPGLGVGDVQDRGGAIVETDEYIRVDVWMGEGMLGLAKALNWGSRQMTCTVYPPELGTSLDFDFSWVSDQLHQSYEASLRKKTYEMTQLNIFESDSSQLPSDEKDFSAPELDDESETISTLESDSHPSNQLMIKGLSYSQSTLSPGLGLGQQGFEVEKLQGLLADLGYYKAVQTGYYDELTRDAVGQFQLDYQIIDSMSQSGAGYFGQKTHAALLSHTGAQAVISKDDMNKKQALPPIGQNLPSIKQLSTPSFIELNDSLHFSVAKTELKNPSNIPLVHELKRNDVGEDVLQLQRLLIREGYLPLGMDTAYYGEMTAQAVFDLQLALGIVNGPLDSIAGRVNSETLSGLNHLFN